MDNWYHAIFDIGGQLGPSMQLCQGGQLVPSSFSRVDNWDHAIFDMGGQLGPLSILLIYWYHLSWWQVWITVPLFGLLNQVLLLSEQLNLLSLYANCYKYKFSTIDRWTLSIYTNWDNYYFNLIQMATKNIYFLSFSS